MTATSSPSTLLALDVGSKRIGIARASTVARLAAPLTTLDADSQLWDKLTSLIISEHADTLIVGLPRSLDGNETDQTRTVRAFAGELEKRTKLPVYFQDEAVTSRQAEQELASRKGGYGKAEIDALAATYILEDYLQATEK